MAYVGFEAGECGLVEWMSRPVHGTEPSPRPRPDGDSVPRTREGGGLKQPSMFTIACPVGRLLQPLTHQS